MPIPEPFASDYRIATRAEILSWSFGKITKTRVPVSDPLENHIGTLNDQRIFGPVVDDRCACGKYNGKEFNGLVCDHCGVKITSTKERRQRFGHIEFRAESIVCHPFDFVSEIKCFPVIPGKYLHSISGRKLCEAYEQLLDDPSDLKKLVDSLLAMATNAIQWNAVDRDVFTRGLGLAPRGAI